jgi:hypothetical protein
MELTRDADKARDGYLGERIAVYGNRTADELVRGGHIEAVLACVQDLRNGARG